MFNFQSGVLDKARLLSNVLMLILLAGNIFFSVQYSQNSILLEKQASAEENQATTRYQVSRFLKFFIDSVISTKGTVSFEDRVKLENDLRQIHDVDLTAQWEAFVGSSDTDTAQINAANLMSLLANKII